MSDSADLERLLASPERLAALRQVGLLDTPPEEAFDRPARLAAQVLRTPVALVSLVDLDRQFFKSCIGLPEPWASWRETPLSHAFCQHLVTGQPLLVEDAREDPLVRHSPAIRDLGVIAYLGVPLLTADGQALGSLCVIDHVPRRWTDDEAAILHHLAAAVMTEMELRVVAREAEQARHEAELALRTRDELLAVVSHDLQNPLTAIKARLQLIQRQAARAGGDLPEGVVGGLVSIERTVGQMTEQIHELLDIARLQAGQPLPLNRQPTDLVSLVRHVLLGQHPVLEQHRVRLDAEEPAVVGRWDRAHLRRVLVNLLSNAAKYSSEDSEIAVSVAREQRGGMGWAVLAVRDRGAGIPAGDLQQVFERFHRGSNVRGVPGSGLGLAGARQIIEQHGGRITVESREGEGSTFTVRLPLE